MPVTREQVLELLERVEETAVGHQVGPAEQAQALADELGVPALSGQARMALVRAYNYTNDRTRMFAPFTWLLQRYDESPDWFGDYERHFVLWTYKWMVSGLIAHPDVPLAQLHSSLDGMRRRYTEAGEGLQPVLGCAYELAAHTRGPQAAVAEFAAWVSAPRTGFSDCAGCEPTAIAQHHAAVGAHDLAVEAVEPVLSGQSECLEQPQAAISAVLGSLLLTGQAEAAASLHLHGSRVSRQNADETDRVARHVLVLARTGNLGRGLDLLAERLADVDRPPTPWDGMELAAAGARLLNAVVDDGHGDTPVRARGAAEPVGARELAARLERHATEVAARFDARNGTGRIGELVRSWLTADPLPPMPLGATARPLGGGVGISAAGPVAARPGPGFEVPSVSTHPRAPRLDDLGALDLSTEQGLSEFAERTELAARFAHLGTAQILRRHWIAHRAAVADVGQQDLVARLEYFLGWSARSGLDEVAREGIASAARRYRELGQPAQALLVAQFLAVENGETERARAMVAEIDAVGTPLQRARARARALVGYRDRTGEEARRVLAAQGLALLGEVCRTDDHERRAVAARLGVDRFAGPAQDGAAEAAQQVLDLLEDGEYPDIAVQALIHRARAAQVRADEDDDGVARTLLARAEEVTRVAGAADAWCYVLLTQARECLSRDDAERAEGLLVRAMAGFEQIAFLIGVADARAELASLMHRQGRLLEAVEVVEAGLAMLEAPEVVEAIAPYQRPAFVYQLGELRQAGSRICAELGESSRAIELARRAVTGLVGLPDREGLAQARFALAELLSADQPLEATSTYAQALADAQLDGDLFLELVIRRERAWARKASDGVDAALADLDDALAAGERARALALADPDVRERLGHWDFEWEPLALAEMRVRLLGSDEQPARALTELDAVPGGLAAQMRAQDSELGALQVEVLRGHLLLDVGGGVEGLAALEAAALTAREMGHEGLQHRAASGMARWLDDQGRPEEAQAAWDRLIGEDA